MIEVVSYRPSDESVEPSATGFRTAVGGGYTAADYSVTTIPPLPGETAKREAIQIGEITSGQCVEVSLPLSRGRSIERIIFTEIDPGTVLIDLGDFLFVLTQGDLNRNVALAR